MQIGDELVTHRDLRLALLMTLERTPIDDAPVAGAEWDELTGLGQFHRLGQGIPPSPGIGVGG